MPSASTSILRMPSASRSSLSHSTKVRSAIAALTTGTTWSRRLLVRTKPPTCCERWRGKPVSSDGELKGQAKARLGGIEAALLRQALIDAALAPAPDARRERADRVLGEAERLADLAHRAARAVVDHGRGDAGVLAAVLPVDVLDDLLAPLVLEVDVDVGRLVALGRDEALEQEIEALGVDLGDAEAEADRGVRRRAAALAEDALAAREAHDVVDGEEVGRVAEPGDQLELVLDLGAHLVRHAVRIAQGGALPGQLLEVLLHAHARGRRIDRVVVAQLVQGKAAGVDDLEAARERFRMAAEQAQDLGRRLQVALGIRFEAEARLVDRAMLADAGQHVLQRPALGHVVEHVAGREQAACGSAAASPASASIRAASSPR